MGAVVTPEEFVIFVQRVSLISHKVEARLAKLDPEARQFLTGTWFEMFKDCDLALSMQGAQKVAVAEDQPFLAEDYIRRIRAYVRETVRGARSDWESKRRHFESTFFNQHGRMPTEAAVILAIGCRP